MIILYRFMKQARSGAADKSFKLFSYIGMKITTLYNKFIATNRQCLVIENRVKNHTR